ncbi:MAG: hypothetical protein A2Z38_06290 [Planctomycetes bacterium RBG_19FT_COMBO_48_8]|nr:MAG: hypothetical protein A2Z38_06290 [Planctomycetes bacterium RBG_19FT_COMBO_48_8]
MELSKVISLLITALYLIFYIIPIAFGSECDDPLASILSGDTVGILGWLALSLICIWWGDELGEGLVGARFGLVSSPSPGWAVKMMGWILLVLPVFIFILIWIMGKNYVQRGS